MQASVQSKPPLTPKSHYGINALAINAGTAVSAAQPSVMEGAICQGWMLKKRRKKMQGYARRYFVLSTGGILSYSFEPGAPVRDQITLRLASISSSANERSRSIHIDSGTSTFHLKALTRTEYALWMSALRRFCTFGPHPDEPGVTMSPRSGRASLSRSIGGGLGGMSSTFATIKTANELGATINELEEVLSELKSESGKGSKRNSSQKPKKEKEKEKDAHKEHGSAREKGGLFGIFHHKGHHSPSPTPSSSGYDNSSFDNVHSAPSSPPRLSVPSQTPMSSLERLASIISTLRSQHSTLLSALESSVNTRTASPLLRTNEEMSQYMSPASRRHSIATLGSGGSIWFDADDGAEEFILEEPISTESNTNVTTEESEDDNVQDEASSDEEAEVNQLLPGAETPTPSSGEAKQLDFNSLTKSRVIIRRTKLPAPTSGDDGSLLAVLRKNVGKDLSTVSFPVSFNEPISILQRLAEDVEYVDLLNQAAATSDPVERICLVAAFAVSGYACTLYRASRKPFNPMLGETFEDIRMNFVSEKVSHHPPVMACHATGKGWVYWATSSADSKFWGRSLEIINRGTNNVKIGDALYKWQKPSTFMRNLIVGEKYLAHEGEMVITDVNSGYRVNIQFKEAGYWGASRNGVSGTVHASNSTKAVARIDGSWHEGLNAQLNLSSSSLKVLWRAHAFPPNAHQYYGFTSFTIGLNEITPDIAEYLPPTDSRLRPDQRAMEEGKIDIADKEKERLEVAQRQRRKQREERGETWTPRWFEPTTDGEWVYKGGYWEARAQKKWDGSEKLW
ncbi:hypothetical protein FRC02_001160 [Tulasnella sp. 418]|nr:hypothetical protein FRC02_001160 [Tulasnella sp. 418]